VEDAREDGEIEESEEGDTETLNHSDLIAYLRSEPAAPQQPSVLPVRRASSSPIRKCEPLNLHTPNLANATTMANPNPFSKHFGKHLKDGPGLRSPVKLQASAEPTLQNLTQFMNANLIQQKRLKANNSQITKVAYDFNSLKQQYKLSFTVPPTTTSAVRAQMRSKLRQFCARYEDLLELRRQMLEKQQAWLEEALTMPVVKNSVHLELAIDLQIEAARDLAAIQEERKLRKELEALVKSN
jgi:hypothetical protein